MRQEIRKTFVLVIMLVFSLILFPHPALALPFQGEFTAKNTCPALISIKQGTNPENLTLEKGKTYQIIGKNQDIPSHYLLKIPSANPSERWVAISCGNFADLPATTTPKTNQPVSGTSSGTSKDYLLALSWQPAFCETKPNNQECQILAKDPNRPEATHFVLHGLWPQPISNSYCGVSKSDISLDKDHKWSDLPAVEKQLSPQTWQKLQAVMPGTLSNLHRHEWIKHGTCYPGTADEYFAEAIELLNAFNNSPVQKVVASKIGSQLPVTDIDQALSTFGASTGEKVEVKCTNAVLGELWVNLEGDITLTTPVSDLLKDAPAAQAEKIASCLIDDARD